MNAGAELRARVGLGDAATALCGWRALVDAGAGARAGVETGERRRAAGGLWRLGAAAARRGRRAGGRTVFDGDRASRGRALGPAGVGDAGACAVAGSLVAPGVP